MEPSGRNPPRTARLVITPGVVIILCAAIGVAVLLQSLFQAARRPIGWAVAALVMAAALEPAVQLMQRYVRRGVALLVVLIPLLAFVGLVAWGVYQDLDTSTEKLRAAIPEAATSIEQSDRFGQVARDFGLANRAEDLAQALETPSSGVANEAVGSGGAWVVCLILTVFALGWGPRFSAGALKQISDPARRDRVARVVGTAFGRSQTYVDLVLLQGMAVGVASWLLFRLFDVPAPTPLALVAGMTSIVPVVGILFGMLPAVLLEAGFDDLSSAGVLLLIVVVAQVAHVALFRQITRRTLYVGPGLMVIAFLIGNDVYGLGGAVFGVAITVFAVALADAANDEMGTSGPDPEAVDPTEGGLIPRGLRLRPGPDPVAGPADLPGAAEA